jgi:hypothetical protein
VAFQIKETEGGVNVQNSKLPRLETEDGEEGEADDKESKSGQIEAAEEEKTVPATYCRPGSARFLSMKSSASRVEWPGWKDSRKCMSECAASCTAWVLQELARVTVTRLRSTRDATMSCIAD